MASDWSDPDRLDTLLASLPFAASWLPESACLVGGAVRDALLDRRRAYLDLDFVVLLDAGRVARQIARRYQAGFVLLDAERDIARVVFPDATVDFAAAEGGSLARDLQRRDFTVNAIAYRPLAREVLDPLDGRADLERGAMRMVSRQNLLDDPLRLLRAYRQAAQLDFQIDPATRAAIRDLAPHLGAIAAERVRTELGYLFASELGSHWLQEAARDRLLQVWLPDATETAVARLPEVDRAAVRLAAAYPKLAPELDRASAKLACLLDRARAETQLTRLKYSRAEIRIVTAAIATQPLLIASPTPRQLYELFQTAGAAFPVAVLVAIACGRPLNSLAAAIARYLDPEDPAAHPTPLLDGKTLVGELDLKPSKLVGSLLREIQIAQIAGQLQTAEDALKFASEQIANGLE